ncbi:hypothetical protein C0989_012628 [Termitomyces sp. Mn162]|nr:hypothetical protein C0989_012628 [Termitomyces sp. Mn162]
MHDYQMPIFMCLSFSATLISLISTIDGQVHCFLTTFLTTKLQELKPLQNLCLLYLANIILPPKYLQLDLA